MDVDKYDVVSDVVVVGYGGAGAVAGITAHDKGARVIVLEKMPAGGGNTKYSGGTFLTPTGIGGVPYIEAISYGTLDQEIVRVFVENAMENESYVRGLGGEPDPTPRFAIGYPCPTGKASFPQVPGSEFMSKWILLKSAGDTHGERLWQLLSSQVERRGIQVLCNTPVSELITNERREVVGVVAEKEGKRIAIKAKRAVILTCGGFEYDESLKWDYLPGKPSYAYGNPGNTGDGIRMAQQVGAALWHMAANAASTGFKCDEYEAAFNISFISEKFIYVGKTGKRFVDETGVELHEIVGKLSLFDTKRMDFPCIPMYAIFDDVARRRGPLNPGDAGINHRMYKWSLDNSAEIAKGWITKAKSIKDLATQIKIDPTVLERTVSTYNEFCKAGKDHEFDRSLQTLVPIDSPPYYAIQLWPCLMNTQGGPRRDKESRVLDPWGKPIPRLYAAGELGSIWGFQYQGSGNNAESLVFGRIAGRNAAAEEPLD